MEDYTKKMIKVFEEDSRADVVVKKTPAAEHLFKVRDEADKLTEGESLLFHNATANALYLCRRAMPDIQTAVSFLTTRVKDLDCVDWKKLVRVLGNLKGTQGELVASRWFVSAQCCAVWYRSRPVRGCRDGPD